jgi:hypothetical protein
MVWYQLIWCNDLKQHHFWLKFADSLPSFGQLKPKNEIGMAQIGHQEHVSHPNITHWTHMDDMKWFGTN